MFFIKSEGTVIPSSVFTRMEKNRDGSNILLYYESTDGDGYLKVRTKNGALALEKILNAMAQAEAESTGCIINMPEYNGRGFMNASLSLPRPSYKSFVVDVDEIASSVE